MQPAYCFSLYISQTAICKSCDRGINKQNAQQRYGLLADLLSVLSRIGSGNDDAHTVVAIEMLATSNREEGRRAEPCSGFGY